MGIIKDIVFNTILIIFKGNRNFFKLINEFQDKLPPQHKKAEEYSDEKMGFTVVNTSEMKMNLTTKEIDLFHKKLENFNYNLVFLKKKEIKSYSKNLQRLLSTSGWDKFAIAMVQKILEGDIKDKPYVFGNKIGKFIGF